MRLEINNWIVRFNDADF